MTPEQERLVEEARECLRPPQSWATVTLTVHTEIALQLLDVVDTLRAEVDLLTAQRDGLRESCDALAAEVARLRAENAELRHDLECAVAEQETIIRESNAHVAKLTHLNEIAKQVLEVRVEIANAARVAPGVLPVGPHPTDDWKNCHEPVTPQTLKDGGGNEGSGKAG